MIRNLQLTTLLLFLCGISLSQTAKFGFKKALLENPDKLMPFAVTNEGESTFNVLKQYGIVPKQVTKEWIFVTSSPAKIDQLMTSKQIRDFHFEVSRPQVMNDSTRMKHFINEVHAGSNGLNSPYTGNNVILGYVDSGIDFYHPDLLDANGDTRVLHFWDQTLDSAGYPNIPQPYGYGLVYDSSDINAVTYVSLGGEVIHGTNTVGIGSGDGSANGTNKGMAPDSKIIFVRSDLSRDNWTLTVADACDYIFKKADVLGLPCVINLSIGDYYGSHDGNDAASIAMEAMLDEKPGRIVVCSAGNSGTYEPFHVRGDVDCDTSFVWFENNPSGIAGPNTIFVDLWANLDDIDEMLVGFGANDSSSNFSLRGMSAMTLVSSLPNYSIVNLTNSLSNQMASIEIFRTDFPAVNSINVQFVMAVDSLSYLYSVLTNGKGRYDLWSSLTLGSSRIAESYLPNAAVYPDIIHYHHPDTMQSIVSSWAASEKVVTVGNVVNRSAYIDHNGNNQVLPAGFYSGVISPGSSQGPSRLDVIKPEVVATGDYTFSASPLWALGSGGYQNKVDAGGMHGRSGGTSASSPVVAGLAALYLEASPNATYQDFIDDLISNTYHDNATGNTINNSYGYGKIHGLNTILNDSISTNNMAVRACGSYTLNGQTYSQSGVYTQILTNQYGNDSIININVEIQASNNQIALSVPYDLSSLSHCGDYQWYNSDDMLIVPGENAQNFTATHTGSYAMILSQGVCVDTSQSIYLSFVGQDELKLQKLYLSPNPTNDQFRINGISGDYKVELIDFSGKGVPVNVNKDQTIDISRLNPGIYFVRITKDEEIFYTKVQRL